MSDPGWAGAILTVDLDAIAANYRLLRDRVAPARCAAVVKADAYGLGAEQVVPVLLGAGCQTFFVAQLEEGIAVRRTITAAQEMQDGGLADAPTNEIAVYVLNGAPPGFESVLREHRLRPVLNSLADIDAWSSFARRVGQRLPAALHVDTGMSRLGLSPGEPAILYEQLDRLDGIQITMVMSHLACADEPLHPLNRKQLHAFQEARRRLPQAPSSFANSSGIFLGRDYHGDLARPGIAIYGGTPIAGEPSPMAQVVCLQGRILQVREIDRGQTVGYGATHRAQRRERIATVAVGYADGYLRSLSNRGTGYIGNTEVPLVGRVSMDLITFDVTEVPEQQVPPGAMIELIGSHKTVDSLATAADTISYELLTGLGRRYHRVYVGGVSDAAVGRP